MGKEIILTVKEGDLISIKSKEETNNYLVHFVYNEIMKRDEISLLPIEGGEELNFRHLRKSI